MTPRHPAPRAARRQTSARFASFLRAMTLPLVLLALAVGPARAQVWTAYAYPNDMNDVTLAGSALFIASTGGAIRYDLESGAFTQYTRRVAGGPPSQLLSSVAFDPASGLVFFGSEDNGVVDYDPSTDRWERFEFLPGNEIQNISPLDGLVYVGTRSGFSIRRSASRTDLCNDIDRGCCGDDPEACDFPSFDVRDWAGTEAAVWAMTSAGPAEFDGARWTARSFGPLNDGRTIEAHGDDVFAAAAGTRAVYRWRSDTATWVQAADGLRPAQGLGDRVRLVDTGAALYLCCVYGLFRWDPETNAWVSTGLEDQNVRGMVALGRPNADLAAATQNGLWIRRLVGPATEWDQELADGPPQNVPGQAVAGSPDGALWFATLGGVQRRSSAGEWTSYRNGAAGGLAPFDVFSIHAASDNRLWVGKCCCRNAPNCPTQFVSADGIVSPVLSAYDGWAMDEDEAGRYWIGSNSTGLTVLNADGSHLVDVAPASGGLVSPSVRAVAAGQGTVWLGHEERGLQIANTNGQPTNPAVWTWRTFTGTGTSPLPDPAVVAVERNGRDAWVLTSSFLVHFTDEVKIRQWALAFDGEPRTGRGLALDRRGNKWVGTSAGILLIDSGGNIQLLTTQNSDVISDEILDVDLDPATGDILFATRIGANRLRPGAGSNPGGATGLYLYPNPFRPDAVAAVKVGGGAADNAEVFDLAGRSVARFDPGVGWDGTTAAGAPAAPGIYLVVVDGGDPLRLALVR
jgi:ligand-binding sensor domain-containing protein